jgi:probable F420-dependent oxidoreductase
MPPPVATWGVNHVEFGIHIGTRGCMANRENMMKLASDAEANGYGILGVNDHLIMPATPAETYPYTATGLHPAARSGECFDAIATLAFLAGCTRTIKLLTSVVVVPHRPAVLTAKLFQTADILSGGRVIVGVGAGWMKDEFLLTGQDFHTRGRRTDEMLTVLAKLFAGGPVEHQGTFYSFPPLTMAPVPTKPVPVYIGGESTAALQRAARHQGWFAGGPYHPDEVVTILRRLEVHRREAGTDDRPFGVIVGLNTPPDLDTFKRLRDEGVTAIINVPWYYSEGPTSTVEHKRDTLERFAEQYIGPLSTD